MAAVLSAAIGLVLADLALAAGGSGRSKPASASNRSAPANWTKSDIVVARARCAAMMRGLDVVAKPMTAFRRGGCGSAAPMKLISIGSKPKVVFEPAPIVNCALVAAMHKWLKRDVQPMARKHLGAAIKTIDVMSSYSCRNAYGRRHGRLSQHARANALDIRGFTTVKGRSTTLLDHWGPTARKLRQMARSATKRRKRNKNTARGGAIKRRTLTAPNKAGSVLANKRAALPKRASTPPRASLSLRLPSIGGLRGTLGRAPPGVVLYPRLSKLGGPRRNNSSAAALPSWRKSIFLRAIHSRACSIFGTVLGPEANHAHRHHFHVDMARRKNGAYCR